MSFRGTGARGTGRSGPGSQAPSFFIRRGSAAVAFAVVRPRTQVPQREGCACVGWALDLEMGAGGASGDMCKKLVFLFLILIASCSVEPDFDASDFP